MVKGKIFYGWYIVFACVLIASTGIGFHNTAGIFIRPVTEDLGFSRGEFTLFRTVIVILSALLLPLFGRFAAKYSIKKMVLIGTTINGLTLAAYSLGVHLWHFYLIAIVGGLVVNAGNFMIIGILINRWFDDKKGLALGISFAGSGLGAAIMNPAASFIIQSFGWRVGYLFSGALALSISIPAILLLLKDSPESMGLTPYRENNISGKDIKADEQQEGLTLAEARKSPVFWLLAIAMLGISISASAPNAHTAPYLGDIGYASGVIAAVVTLTMVILTLGKIVMGHMFDRFGTVIGGFALGIFCILSPVFALLAFNPIAPWFHAVFLGLASTGFSLTGNIYAAKFFGKKDFPAILSTLTVITTLGAAISPPVMGFAYDLLSSYNVAWIALVGIGFVVTLCLAGANAISTSTSKRRILLWNTQN